MEQKWWKEAVMY